MSEHDDGRAEAIHRTLAEQGMVSGDVPWERLTGTARRPFRDAADLVASMVEGDRTPRSGAMPSLPRSPSTDDRRRPHRGPYRAA